MKFSTQFKMQKIQIDWDKIGQNLLSIIWQLAITTLIFLFTVTLRSQDHQ